MEFGDDDAFAVDLNFKFHWKKQQGILSVRGRHYALKGEDITVRIYPYDSESIFAKNEDNVNELRQLELIARTHNFDVKKLCNYMANTVTMRPKGIEQYMNIPPFVVKGIIAFCMGKNYLSSVPGGYRKTQSFSQQLESFRAVREGEKRPFVFLKEGIVDVIVKGDPSMELYASTENGNVMLVQEIDRVQQAGNVKKHVKEEYIERLRKWLSIHKKNKRQRMKDAGFTDMQIALELGKDEDDSDSDSDSDSNSKYDAVQKKKNKKKEKRKSELDMIKEITKEEGYGHDTEPEYDDTDTVNPITDGKHFRKKKLKKK